MHLLGPLAQRHRPILTRREKVARKEFVALRDVMILAGRAGPTRVDGPRDRIALLHPTADPLDTPRTLMPQNHGHWGGQMTRHHPQIGMAHPGCHDLDQNFIRTWVLQHQRLGGQTFPSTARDRGLGLSGHGAS
jgi:hypothetical protein